MRPVSRPVEPPENDDWLALTEDELPVGAAYDWAVRPHCGAVVLFSGTVRDHAEGRDGVEVDSGEADEGDLGAHVSMVEGAAGRRKRDRDLDAET